MTVERGNTYMLCGDCLQYLPMLPDKSIDMILCDLPYGITRNKWDSPIPLKPLWKEYRRVIKDNGAILLFGVQPFVTDLINSNRKEYRYEIIWEKTMKTGFLNANRMPLRAHENIIVFYKKLPVYNPQKSHVKTPCLSRRRNNANRAPHYGVYHESSYTDTGERYPTDVIRFYNWNGARFGDTRSKVLHPTSKPVPLLEYLIKTYTNEGDIVLDNAMGSGSTGVACARTNRGFVGIELDAGYYDIAKERVR